jgi:clan AA aspartic protease
MIYGRVTNALRAVVRLRVRGPGGVVTDVEAVVDTGFTAELVLPPGSITALGLPPVTVRRMVLADGSVRKIPIYAAEITWGTGWRPILVSGIGNESLIGMSLLAGHELHLAAVPGGVVAVSPLP